MAKKLKAKLQASEARVQELEAGGAGASTPGSGDSDAALQAELKKEKAMVVKLKTKLKAEMKKNQEGGASEGGGGDPKLVQKLKLKCKKLMKELAEAQAGGGASSSSSGDSAEVKKITAELKKRIENHKRYKEELRTAQTAYKEAGDSAGNDVKKAYATAKARYKKSDEIITNLKEKLAKAKAKASAAAAAASTPDDGAEPNDDDTASVASSSTAGDADKYKAMAQKYKKMAADLQTKLKAAKKAAAAASSSSSAPPTGANTEDPGSDASVLSTLDTEELVSIILTSRRSLAHKEEKIANLQTDLARLEALDPDLEALNLDRDIAQATAENYKLEIDALKLELDDLRLDMEVYRARESEYSLATLEEASNENLAVQKLFYKSMEKQNKKLREALVEVREVAASDRNAFKRQLDELAAVSQQYPIVQAQVLELEDQISSYLDDIEHLKDQLDATGDASAELEAMAEEKLLAEETTDALRVEVSELNHLLQLSEATLEAHLEEQIRLTEMALEADLRADSLLADLESAHDQLESSMETISQFRTLVADLEAQVSAAGGGDGSSGGPSNAASSKLAALMAASADMTAAASPDAGYVAAAARRAAAAFQSAVADLTLRGARLHASLLAATLPDSFQNGVSLTMDNECGTAVPHNVVALIGIVARMQGAANLVLTHFSSLYDFVAGTKGGVPVSLDDLAPVSRVLTPVRVIASLLQFLGAGLASSPPSVLARMAEKADDLRPMESHLSSLLDAIADDNVSATTSLDGLDRIIDRVQVLLSHLSNAATTLGSDESSPGPSEADDTQPENQTVVGTATSFVGRAPPAVPLSDSIRATFEVLQTRAISSLLSIRKLEASLTSSVVPAEEALSAAKARAGDKASPREVTLLAMRDSGAPTGHVMGALEALADELSAIERGTAKLVKSLGSGALALSNQAWEELDAAWGLLEWLPVSLEELRAAVGEALISEPPEDLESLASLVAAAYTSSMGQGPGSDMMASITGYVLPEETEDSPRSLAGVVDGACTASGHVKHLVGAFLGGEYDDTSDEALAASGSEAPALAHLDLAEIDPSSGGLPTGSWVGLLNAYRDHLVSAESLGPALDSATAEKERLQRAAKGREQALQEAKVQSDVLAKRIEVLQERIDAVDELEAKVHKLEKSEKSFRDAIAALRKENEELKTNGARNLSPLAAFTRNVTAGSSPDSGAGVGPGPSPAASSDSGSPAGSGSSSPPKPAFDLSKLGKSGGLNVSGDGSGSAKDKGKSILAALSGGNHKHPILSRDSSSSSSSSGSASSEAYVRAIKYLRDQVQELKAALGAKTLNGLEPLVYGQAKKTPGTAAVSARRADYLLRPSPKNSAKAVARRSTRAATQDAEIKAAVSKLGSLMRETETALAAPKVVDVTGSGSVGAGTAYLAQQQYVASLASATREVEAKLRGLVGEAPTAFGGFGTPVLNAALDEGVQGTLIGRARLGGVGGTKLLLSEKQLSFLTTAIAPM